MTAITDLRSIGMAAAAALSLAAALALAIGPLTGNAAAQDTDAEESVELARDALSKRRYPWYEPQKDAVRPLRLGKKTETKTAAQPKTPQQSTSTRSSRSGFTLFGSALQVVGLLILTLVLGAVAALIAWAFLRNETAQTQGARVVAASREVDRVEQLPFALKRASGDFLSEARRLAEEGNYSEAIVYLYSHLLVELDKQHVIRLAKGKTNRQYLRETRVRPALAETLETTMIAFEDVFFGRYALSRERFAECIGQVDRFETDLAQLERAAA